MAVTVFLVTGNGCNDPVNLSVDGAIAQQAGITSTIFTNATTEFEVKVFYEAGAEPYVGNIGLSGNQTWQITKSSYQSLFQNHPGRTVTVPMTLAAMTAIPNQAKTNWTTMDLINLGNQYAPALKDNQSARVSLIFLNGIFEGKNEVLGVHFAGTHFAFVFKDVVLSVGGDAVSQRYVEQGTAVHELGHAVGLVNNGLPMVVAHEDGTHPKHSSNTSCVMFWQVESKSDILSSLAGVILGNKLDLFGTESLQDGRSYHP